MPAEKKTIHSLIDLSEKEGVLSAMHPSVAENTRYNLSSLLSAAEGASRHIRLPDRDIWLAFEPTSLSLKAAQTDSAQGMDAPGFTATATGTLSLYVCTDDGIVFSSTVSKQADDSILTKNDNDLINWVLRQEDPVKSKIAINGRLQNRLDSTLIERNLMLPVSEMQSWQRSGLDHLDNRRSTKPSKSDLLSRGGGLLNNSSTTLSATKERTMDLHVDSFGSDSLYRQIMGAGLADAQLALDERSSVIKQFLSGLNEDVLKGRMAAIQAATDKQHQRLLQSGVHIDLSSEAAREIYSLPVMNFIAGGQTKDSVLYRAQFINQTLTLMLGPDWTRPDTTANMDLSTMGIKIKNLISSRYNENVADQAILNAIDSGRYPSKELSEKWRLPNMGSKQFKRALSLIGGYGSLQQNKGGLDLQLYSLFSLVKNHQDAATLAKLPEEWFYWGDDKLDILSVDGITELGQHSSRYEHENISRIIQQTLPYLLNTGAKYDALKGTMGAAHASGEDINPVKQQIRDLGLQWRWMTSGPGSLSTRLEEFDKKYKLLASFKDYPMVLDTLIRSVVFRCALDHPHLSRDVFIFNENHATLQLHDGALNGELHAHLADGMDETEMVWDEDLQQEVEVEAESPQDLYGDISLPYVESLKRAISSQETDFRVPVRLNDELHKVYSRFLRDANDGSTTNVQWDPLLDETLSFPGFELHSISDRLELLTEGTEMQHCVFSYLSKCLRGESVILSAREPGTGRRLATIELTPERAENEQGEEYASFELVQCYGYSNSRNTQIDAIRDQILGWLKDVNDGLIPTNGLAILDDESRLTEVYEKIERNPAQNGALLEPIPYNEDGVFLSYYLFNQYTPAGMTVENIMTSNTLLGEMYYGSQFSKDIAKIESMAALFNMSPEQVVQTKMKNRIPDWDSVDKHLQACRAVAPEIRNVINTYATILSHEQVFQKVADALSTQGMSFSDSYELAQFQRDMPRDDLLLNNVRTIQNKPATAESSISNTHHVGIDNARRRA